MTYAEIREQAVEMAQEQGFTAARRWVTWLFTSGLITRRDMWRLHGWLAGIEDEINEDLDAVNE